jgi:hypothetical protein
MIITRGFVTNNIITRGYGITGLIKEIIVEIFRFKSALFKILRLTSNIP